MPRPDRFVYLITALRDDPDCGPSRCISDMGCVFSSRVKAQANLRAILQEIEEEATREDYTYNFRWGDAENSLEVEFGTGCVEEYAIHKVKLN